MSTTVSRRHLLTSLPAITAAVSLAVSCRQPERPVSCTDTAGLSDLALRKRLTLLRYEDRSPYPSRTCLSCQLFRSAGDHSCGTCTVLEGPVNPGGFYQSWMAKEPP